MSSLYIINRTLNQERIKQLQKQLLDKDDVLLIEEAVYMVFENNPALPNNVYLLESDVIVRGLAERLDFSHAGSKHFNLINQSAWVDLTLTHKRCITISN
ncbi:MAG: DsrH/TusB family sulfur metabolism protein [Kangiellaceae bacterium]|jgi:sulfur relay protein TusB/DsrH|nr:DsrH/TusB family sulfur metabolism protein [Kangiellaceae bacterium]